MHVHVDIVARLTYL